MRGTYCNEEIVGDFRCGLAMESVLKNCRFDQAKLDGINCSGSKLTNCTFDRCTLNGAVLSASTLTNCEFIECELDMARFDAAILQNVGFTGGRAEYSSFQEATVLDSRFDIQLHGADLRFADSRNVDYGDSNLWGAAITAGCAQFRGNRFSDRQVDIFLALVAQASGPERRARIEAVIEPKYLEMATLLLQEAKT